MLCFLFYICSRFSFPTVFSLYVMFIYWLVVCSIECFDVFLTWLTFLLSNSSLKGLEASISLLALPPYSEASTRCLPYFLEGFCRMMVTACWRNIEFQSLHLQQFKPCRPRDVCQLRRYISVVVRLVDSTCHKRK